MNKISRRKALSLSAFSVLGSSLGLNAGSEKGPDSEMLPAGPVKLIVFGAHPDDPETGCGGTMALWADAGHTVTAAYLTRGEAGIKGKSHSEAARIRTGEAEDACRILGAHPVFMSQVDGSTVIDESRYEEVYRFLEDENPDIVVTHWPIDTHRDHRICSLLVYDAWLRLQRSFSLYYFEVMSGLQSQNFQPTQYIDITSVAERKHRACFAHESQGIREEYPNDHGQMEIFRGLEAGYSLAEAFIRHTQSHHIPLK